MSKRVIFLIVFIVGLGMFLASAANADLVAWWTFDEGGGATAFDATGNGHDGAINGAQTTEGQMGLALLFDEVDDRVVVPDFDYSPEFSVTFWFRSSGNAGTLYQYMFSHAPYNASNSVNIYLCENNQTTPGVLRTALVDADDVTNQEGLDVVAGFADGNWHHYALTVGSGVGANVYVDALLQVSLASQGGDAFDPASDLYLGARVDLNAQRFFGGALDDVRVYNHPLSEAEIQEAMAGIPRGTASAPSPADQATDVPRDVVLSWRPGEYAPAVNGHIVHLSENFSDVNDGVGGITQSANSHAPGRLDFETTYYWRVDEVKRPSPLVTLLTVRISSLLPPAWVRQTSALRRPLTARDWTRAICTRQNRWICGSAAVNLWEPGSNTSSTGHTNCTRCGYGTPIKSLRACLVSGSRM
jgi:hypothetical protein